ncbi:hypothetical protein B1218_34695 [Pseudomonas ogarae]|nr:hypothetical protein B1218_34695 [Pseudomonas ogarae]
MLLRGVYFTSGTQEGSPIDRLIGSIAQSINLDRQHPARQTGTCRLYITDQLHTAPPVADRPLVPLHPKTTPPRRRARRARGRGRCMGRRRKSSAPPRRLARCRPRRPQRGPRGRAERGKDRSRGGEAAGAHWRTQGWRPR